MVTDKNDTICKNGYQETAFKLTYCNLGNTKLFQISMILLFIFA